MKKQDFIQLMQMRLLQAGVQPGEAIVVAVSGGADSMVLLDLLNDVRDQYNLELVVVHVNHGLRSEAKQDQQLVEEYCKDREIRCVVKKVNVKARLGKRNGGVEEQARKLRYQALRQVARAVRARFIVTAHNRDDQVETVVFNFLRGGGLRGLGGMREVSGDILRPLLLVPKADLLKYAKQQKIPFRDDASNQSLEFTRNKIRLELLPVLRQYNPNLDSVVAANSYIFDQADTVVKDLARHYLEVVGKMSDKKAVLSISQLKELSPFMQIEVIKAAIIEVVGGLQNIKKVHFDEIFQLLLTDKTKSSKRLPGKLFVQKAYDKITISRD